LDSLSGALAHDLACQIKRALANLEIGVAEHAGDLLVDLGGRYGCKARSTLP